MGIGIKLKGAYDVLFGRAIPTPLKNNLIQYQQQQTMMLQGIAVYGKDNAAQQVQTYITNDDIYSITRRIAKTAATIPLYVYKIKDDKKFKQYESLLKQKSYTPEHRVKMMILKEQALELVPDNDPYQTLLDNPNRNYDKTEFKEGFYGFRLLTGNGYIYTPTLDLGPNAGKVSEMWLLPSQYTQPKILQSFPREITSYQLTIFAIIDLPKEEVAHSRYFNPDFDAIGSELVGLSPLTAGAKVIQRSYDETNYMVAGFQNSGISGIVANEGVSNEDVTPEILGKLKSDFYQEGTGVHNARKLLFQAGKINYIQIGLGPVDMDVINSQKLTFKKLCNLYGVDDRLFNNDTTGSENSVEIMERALYLNAALPEVYALRDTLNKHLSPKFSTKGVKYFVDADISDITVLQSDMKKMAEVFSAVPFIKGNLIAEALGVGRSDDPLMDKWFIKTGYVPLEDTETLPPIDNTGDY